MVSSANLEKGTHFEHIHNLCLWHNILYDKYVYRKPVTRQCVWMTKGDETDEARELPIYYLN